MTVTVKDTARRCDRCGRVTLGTKFVQVLVDGQPHQAARACTACRSDLTDSFWAWLLTYQSIPK